MFIRSGLENSLLHIKQESLAPPAGDGGGVHDGLVHMIKREMLDHGLDADDIDEVGVGDDRDYGSAAAAAAAAAVAAVAAAHGSGSGSASGSGHDSDDGDGDTGTGGGDTDMAQDLSMMADAADHHLDA